MDYIVNSLSAYELHVARYYFRRGAYLAAVNRAQQAVKDYQQTPAGEEALYIMAQSYDRLGLEPVARRRRPGAEEELPAQPLPARRHPPSRNKRLVAILVAR